MAAYKKKYLTLPEASVISGYTAKELRNFCKIGLVPSRKYKSQILIRFDAFEKLNQQRTMTEPKIKNSPRVSPAPSTAILPFTKPNRQLVSVLQPVALAAALVMVLYMASLPGNAESFLGSVVYPMDTVAVMADSTESLIATSIDAASVGVSFSQATLDFAANQTAGLMLKAGEVSGTALAISQGTLAYLADQSSNLIVASYSLSSSLVDQVASTPVHNPRSIEDARAERVARSTSLKETSNEAEMVAGLATQNQSAQTAMAAGSEVSGPENFLISVADGADSFQRFVSDLDNKAFNALINSLRFETLDQSIQETFRW